MRSNPFPFRVLVFLLTLRLATTARSVAERRSRQLRQPVEKVIKLLDQLAAQLKDEQAKDLSVHTDMMKFCKEQKSDKRYGADQAQAKIELDEVDVKDSREKEIDRNNKRSDAMQKIGKLNTQVAKAAVARKAENEVYSKKNKDIETAIQAINDAIEAIKKDALIKREDGRLDSLLQTKLERAIKAVQPVAGNTSFIQIELDRARWSGDTQKILDVLDALKESFITSKEELDSKEKKAQYAYEMKHGANKDLLNELKDGKKDFDEELGKAVEAKQEALTDLAEEQTEKKDSLTVLGELQRDCGDKEKGYTTRTEGRTKELDAILKCKAIMEGDVRANQGILLEASSAPTSGQSLSLVQFTGGLSAKESATKKVLELLSEGANRMDSSVLTIAAMRISSSQAKRDPFVRIRGMLKDLVKQLEEEAKADGEQKAWCDKEMTKSTEKRDTGVENLESHTADKMVEKGKTADMTEKRQKLLKEIAAEKQALKEATELRAKEEAENKNTMAMARAALRALELAEGALRKGYGAESEDQDAKDIFSWLEVLVTQFKDKLTMGKDAETKSSTEYNALSTKSKKETDDKEEDSKNTGAAIVVSQNAFEDAREKIADDTTDKSAAETSLRKLKPLCVGGSDSETRFAKRLAEVELLRQAHKVLDEADV